MANNAEQAPEWDQMQKGTDSAMDNLVPAFTNLSEATALDRQSLANLALAQAFNQEDIGRLRTELAATKKSLGEAKQAPEGKNSRTNRRLHYYWSHGSSFNPDHTSCS